MSFRKKTLPNTGCVSGRTVRIETFEQLINFGAGRQFSVSKAHQRKARNRSTQAKQKNIKIWTHLLQP